MTYRFVGERGEFNVVRKGISRAFWNDIYHWLIKLSWRYFWLLPAFSFVPRDTAAV